MSFARYSALVLISMLSVSRSYGDEQSDRIQVAAKKEATALQQGDFDTVISFTYPKVVEMAGGRDKMKSMLATGTQEMKAQGMAITSVELGDPQPAVAASGKLFSVVPMTLTLFASDAKITQKSFC